MDGMKISIDGLALLADALCKAGNGELVEYLFNEYEIKELHELSPAQYEPFADAISGLVEGGAQ